MVLSIMLIVIMRIVSLDHVYSIILHACVNLIMKILINAMINCWNIGIVDYTKEVLPKICNWS